MLLRGGGLNALQTPAACLSSCQCMHCTTLSISIKLTGSAAVFGRTSTHKHRHEVGVPPTCLVVSSDSELNMSLSPYCTADNCVSVKSLASKKNLSPCCSKTTSTIEQCGYNAYHATFQHHGMTKRWYGNYTAYWIYYATLGEGKGRQQS